MKPLHPFNTKLQWGKKDQPTTNLRPPDWSSGNQAKELPKVTRKLTMVEELAEQAKTGARITVQVLGVGKATRQGLYTLPFREGASLTHYFKLLGLVRTATKARVYDLSNPSAGRRRLNYVPQADSRILIGNKDYSPWGGMQRAGGRDAMAIAKAMGGGAKVVEAPLIGRKATAASSTLERRPGKAMDDLDVDQF